MSKAYRCDRCSKMADGSSDMQLHFDDAQAQAAQAMLGIKWNPQLETAPIHPHDLCPSCMKSFIEWYSSIRRKAHGEPEENQVDDRQVPIVRHTGRKQKHMPKMLRRV